MAVRTSVAPALATDSEPTMVTAMIRPKMTSETRSMGSSRRWRPSRGAFAIRSSTLALVGDSA